MSLRFKFEYLINRRNFEYLISRRKFEYLINLTILISEGKSVLLSDNDSDFYSGCTLIYLLTAVGLTPGGSSTVHIYTQIIHRTTPRSRYTEQNVHNNKNT